MQTPKNWPTLAKLMKRIKLALLRTVAGTD